MIDDDDYWFNAEQISFDFIQDYTDVITSDHKVEKKKEKIAGSYCNSCKIYCQFSEPNQKDGKFICYSCRNPW